MSAYRSRLPLRPAFHFSPVQCFVAISLIGMALLVGGGIGHISLKSRRDANASEPSLTSYSEPAADEYWGLVR